MEAYLAETPITLPVLFSDNAGNVITPSVAMYRIVDQHGNELVPITPFDLSQSNLEISAQTNTLSNKDTSIPSAEAETLTLSEVRIVEFDLEIDGNFQPFEIVYTISPRDGLVVGFNSFQTLREAFLTSAQTSLSASWLNATNYDRTASMIEARNKICTYDFKDIITGQSRIQKSVGDLTLLSPKEFVSLSPNLKSALKIAQMIEASVILGDGDQSQILRKQGLISQTIGETQEVWRNSSPLDLPLSKEALRYLSRFIVTGKRIARG